MIHFTITTQWNCTKRYVFRKLKMSASVEKIEPDRVHFPGWPCLEENSTQKKKQLAVRHIIRRESMGIQPNKKHKPKSRPHLSTKFPALGVAERANATGFGTLHCALLNCHTHFCLHFSISLNFMNRKRQKLCQLYTNERCTRKNAI